MTGGGLRAGRQRVDVPMLGLGQSVCDYVTPGARLGIRMIVTVHGVGPR